MSKKTERHPPAPLIRGELSRLVEIEPNEHSTAPSRSVGTGFNRGEFYLLAIAIMLFIGACSGADDRERPEVPEEVDIRPDVIFAIADDRPLHIYIESQGIAEPIREITIRPRISGFITDSALDDGNQIEDGDPILVFDAQEWQYQLQQAENEYETALVAYNIEINQRESQGDTPQNENRERMVRISTGLADAELALERAKLDFSYTTLNAPFSGELSVPDRFAIGAYISAGSELGRLVDDTTLLVRFDVLEAELNRLNSGMTVELFTPAGERKEGRIRAISPVVNPESKTGQVVVEVENRNRDLRPGMTVEGRIRVESHNGIARVPRAAILERDGGRTLVFKLGGEQVEWVYVTPEYSTSEWAIINSEDIAPGDTLAIDRHFALSHLQFVRPRMAGEIVLENGIE